MTRRPRYLTRQDWLANPPPENRGPNRLSAAVRSRRIRRVRRDSNAYRREFSAQA